MTSEDEMPTLHAALKGEVEKKRQWLREQGVSVEDIEDVASNLEAVLQYIEKEQITSIPLDELKAKWIALDKETGEEIKTLIVGGADINARDETGETALHAAASSGKTDMTGETALHAAASSGKTDMVSLLLERGADIAAADSTGETALHAAASSGKTDMVSLLLERGADMNAVDEDNQNPLISMIWRDWGSGLDEKVAIARLLCSRGSDPNLSLSADKSSLEKHQLGLLACAHHWHECYEKGEPLTEIQSEVIEGGEDAVRTFLDDLKKTRSDQLVYRSKVCIVGPSTWGKTSLVKSMTENEPSLVDIKDRTIGIDLFPFTFEENSNDGTESKVKRHDVTFWDFAGQDIYQVTHALFFSERTLYLICVDLSAYAEKLGEVETCTSNRSENDDIIQRFFEEHVLRWVRLILFRQPSAQFKVIGTKFDLISKPQWDRISVDMNCRINSFVENLDKDGVADEVKRALDAEFERDNLVKTSADRVESIEQARKSIEQAIIAKPNLNFTMTATYSQVRAQILKIKGASENATPEGRVKQVIVTFNELFKMLMRNVPNLKNAGECREILLVLHKLGDIFWYEDENMSGNKMIILDPKLILELVREVVNHKYEEENDRSYEALRRDGTLHHSLLMTFPFWKALEAVRMVGLFKHVLWRFDLAYPANNVEKLDTVDMIVPAYWGTRAAAEKAGKSLAKQPSVLTKNDVVGLAIAKWQYSLPVDISEAVYVNFVVQCYRPDVVRNVEATSLECFVRGEFFAVISFAADRTEYCDHITIEVAAATKEIAWVKMRDFVMAMEGVLLNYPGLKATKSEKFSRCIIHSNGPPNEVSSLMGDTQGEEQLRSKMPWLPPDFGWFIQSAWTKPGKLDELKAQKITLQLLRQLNVLKQLVVNDERRRFPALWRLSYSNKVIELRILSDLSGRCFHNPLRIKVPSDFLRRHANLIQAGVSVLSVVVSLIPIEVAKTAFDLARSALGPVLDRDQAVISFLETAGLNQGEVKSATEFGTLKSRMAFLLELLKLHDPPIAESKVDEVANLCCAIDEKGCYVWVHQCELEEMKGKLTRYEPPIGPSTTSSPNSTSITICVTGLRQMGYTKSRKIYCDWEIIHQSSPNAIQSGKIEEAADSGANIVKLDSVTSFEMLCECTVKVSVKQPHRYLKFFGDKEIGCGEMKLKDHFGTDCSDLKLVKVEIPLTDKKIPQPPTVICEISIESTASSSS
ncbi:hypothetical protein PHYBOEH_011576 [Phytophthora boehmeriae]|uniref:Non-specific serine/threonine protein kinase n=1 Tax=Phytophthora boehmeriae TaxID=109152 RepID=A0A8T1VJ18_9STRA|nr:hypothetical protein PHYBOEH_011576 [Phytophthora boehmeriae]